MQNRTLAVVLTVIVSLVCLCAALFACIPGIMIAIGTPWNVDINGMPSVQTFPPTYGYVMVCLSVLFILVPVIVGIFTLRKPKVAAAPPPPPSEPMPPAVQ